MDDGRTCNSSPGVIHILDRIENKLEKIQDVQIDQGKTLVRNTMTLEEHVRRTNILEKKNDKLEDKVDDAHEKCDARVNKIDKDLSSINLILQLLKPTKQKAKWIALTGSLLASLYGGYEVSNSPDVKIKATETIEKILK